MLDIEKLEDELEYTKRIKAVNAAVKVAVDDAALEPEYECCSYDRKSEYIRYTSSIIADIL